MLYFFKKQKIQIIIIVLMGFILSSPSFGQKIIRYNISSEAPIIHENGIKKSNQITVAFKYKVITITKGKRIAAISNINKSYKNLSDYFKKLHMHYGYFNFIKMIPDAKWGDMTNSTHWDQLFAIRFNSFVEIDKIIKELKELPEVSYAHQPVQIVSLADPNDPFYQQNDQWDLERINASKAWDITKGSEDVVVGIIESAGLGSGIPDEDHEEFFDSATGKDKFIHTYDYDSTYTNDNGEHATNVAGIIGAFTDNNKGIASLGWNLKMAPYSFSNEGASKDNLFSLAYDIINASIQCDVINCSFIIRGNYEEKHLGQNGKCCCYQYRPGDYQDVDDSFDRAIRRGVIVVAGTGNWGYERTNQAPECLNCWRDLAPYTAYPAKFDGVIGVSAIDCNDNFGRSRNGYPYNTGSEFIDVTAPGIDK